MVHLCLLSETGDVIGVLYAGLDEIDVALDKKTYYRVPTAISYVVPSHYIQKGLEACAHEPNIRAPDDAMTIPEMLAKKKLSNAFEQDNYWIVKEQGPDPRVAEKVKFERVLDSRKDKN